MTSLGSGDYVECGADEEDRKTDEASSAEEDDADEEGGGTRQRSKKSKKSKKKKKKKKKGGKKGDSGRIDGKKPYKDEAPDMIKFDDDAERDSKGSSSGSSSLYAIDSDDSSSEEESEEEEDFSSYDSETSSDMEEINYKSEDDGKKSKKQKKGKKKRRKARGAGVGASFVGRFFSIFTRKKDRASADERVPMNLAPAGDGYEPAVVAKRSGGGGRKSGSSYGDWGVGTMFSGGSRIDFDPDLVEDAANQIRMEDAARAKRFRRKCCIFLAVLAVIGGIVGLTFAVWFDYGDFAKLKKHFLGQGGGRPKRPSGKNTPGLPFDANADVAGICSEEDVSTFNGYYACRGLCDSAYCCFLPPWESHTCTSKFAAQCAPYTDACAILDRVEQPRSPSGGGGGGGVKEGALPPADPNLLSLCSGANVKSSGGLAKCNDACKPGKCCFVGLAGAGEGSGVEDCYMDNKYACAAYHPCVDAVTFQTEIGVGEFYDGANATEDAPVVIHVHNFQFERRRLVLDQACSKRGMAVSDACEKYCVGYECCFGDEAGKDDDTCHDERTCMEVGSCANLLAR